MGTSSSSQKNDIVQYGVGQAKIAVQHRISVEQAFAMDDAQFRQYVIIASHDLSELNKEIVHTSFMRLRLVRTKYTGLL